MHLALPWRTGCEGLIYAHHSGGTARNGRGGRDLIHLKQLNPFHPSRKRVLLPLEIRLFLRTLRRTDFTSFARQPCRYSHHSRISCSTREGWPYPNFSTCGARVLFARKGRIFAYSCENRLSIDHRKARPCHHAEGIGWRKIRRRTLDQPLSRPVSDSKHGFPGLQAARCTFGE